jgi:hypothetical protein
LPAAIAAIDKRKHDEKDPLVTGKYNTFLGTSRALEVVFDASAKSFQPLIIFWKRESWVLATRIDYRIESGEGEL